MIHLFELLLLNSIIIIGFSAATDYEMKPSAMSNYNGEKQRPEDVEEKSKMILWKVRFYSIRWFGEYWSKPICTCITCMASLHSTYVYWFFNEWTIENLITYPLYILALAGLNHIIGSKI